MRKSNIELILTMLLFIVFFSCQREESKCEPYHIKSKHENLVSGTLNNGLPVGIWRYNDLYGTTIKKSDYQVDYIDSIEVISMETYYSPNGTVLSIYGISIDTTSFEIYSQNSLDFNEHLVGEILSEEYCKSCHNLFTRSLGESLKGHYEDGDLTHQNIISHKSVVEPKLRSDRLSKIPENQIDLIIKYVESAESIVVD